MSPARQGGPPGDHSAPEPFGLRNSYLFPSMRSERMRSAKLGADGNGNSPAEADKGKFYAVFYRKVKALFSLDRTRRLARLVGMKKITRFLMSAFLILGLGLTGCVHTNYHPKTYINPATSKEFGPKWTEEIQHDLELCETTVKKLPPASRCDYYANRSLKHGGMLRTRPKHQTDRTYCYWTCNKSMNDYPYFWDIEAGPWHLDTVGHFPKKGQK